MFGRKRDASKAVQGAAFDQSPRAMGPPGGRDLDEDEVNFFDRRAVERDLIHRGEAARENPSTTVQTVVLVDLFVVLGGGRFAFYVAGSVMLPAHVGFPQVEALVVGGAVRPGTNPPVGTTTGTRIVDAVANGP